MKKLIYSLGVFLALLAMSPTLFGAANVTQSGFTGVIVPQYISTGTSTRLPVIFRATVSGLTASTSYRYYIQGVQSSDFGGTNSGAGNPLLVSTTGNYTYTTGPGLSTAGTYETFTTDGTGSYTGWFAFVNTGAAAFTAGNTVYPCITLNAGGTGTSVSKRLALDLGLTALAYSTSAGANNGTFLKEASSSATAKNVALVYDNIFGSGRPLYAAPIEATGVTIASVISGYTTTAGGWNAIIPNNNANGVRRIEQRSITTGAVVSCAKDADGSWTTGPVNTVNPTGGTTAISISNTDAPLNSGCSAFLGANPASVSGLLAVTNAASATPGSFVLSGSELSTASVTITPPAGFEISLSSGSGFQSTALTIANGTGNFASPSLTNTTVYVRLASTPTPGTPSGDITIAGGGTASNLLVHVSGTVSDATLTLTPNTLSGFSTPISTPSTAQYFDITASGLVSASGNFGNFTFSTGTNTDWEFSIDGGSTFVDAASLSLGYSASGSTISYTSGSHVYARLKSGLTFGPKSATLTVSGGGAADATVYLSGTVLTPTITLTPTSLSGFCGQVSLSSDVKTYTLAATNLNTLTGTIAISSSTTDWELSTDNFATAGQNSLSVSYTGGAISPAVTISVRIKSGLTAGVKTATLTNAGGGDTKNVTLNGGVTDPASYLNPGDISLIGIKSTNYDAFAFVTWVDLANNTSINFTDNAYDGTKLLTNENNLVWTNNTGATIGAGTVVTFQATSSAIPNSITPADLGSNVGDLNGLNASGENIFAYQGTLGCPTFLHGLSVSGPWITTGIVTTANSYLPTALNISGGNIANPSGTVANTEYTGSRSNQFSLSSYKALVNNYANWASFSAGNNSTTPAPNSTDFTLATAPTIGLTVSATSGTEAASTVITVTLSTGGIAVVGDQVVDLTVTGTGITSGDYTLSSPSITILNGATSGTATFTIVNDPDAEGTEVATIGFSIPVTTTGVVAGTPATQSITILDNDVTYYSVNSGNHDAAIWSTNPADLPANGVAITFNSGTNIVIQNGHTVTIHSSPVDVNNITVNTGGRLYRNDATQNISNMRYFNVYGDITCNGEIGNGAIFDPIGFYFEGGTGANANNLNGSGTNNFNAGRISKKGNTVTQTTLNINRDIDLWYPGTAMYNNTNGGARIDINIPSGVNVDFHGVSDLSIDGTSGTGSGDRGGIVTVSGSITNLRTLFALSDNSAAAIATNGLTINNGGQVDVNIVTYNSATGTGTGAFNLNLASGSFLNIYTGLELRGGTFTAPAGSNVVLKSTATNRYAYIDNFTGTYSGIYSGNITAELFVPTGLAGTNQHFIGSPVSGATLGGLGANSSGGQVIPTATCDETQANPSTPNSKLFEWRENVPNMTTVTCPQKGWLGKVSTDPVVAAKGYSAYLTAGATVSISGVPNIDKTANAYSVSGLGNSGWTLNTLQSASTSFHFTSGWHLVSNPYPNNITLNGHAGFDDAAIYNPTGPFKGTFSSVNPNNGTANIAPFQGFYVHVASGTQTWTVATTERNITTGTAYHSQSSPNALTVQVSGNGYNDITQLEFNSSATAQFDAGLDSRKLRSVLGQPTLYTWNNNEHLAYNVNRSIEETPAVAMGLLPGASGAFTLSFDGLNTFDPTSYIYLEDKVTGTWTDVRQNPTYSFNMNATDNELRFVLHFTPAVEINAADATCSADGLINISQQGASVWSYSLSDATNAVISSGTLNQASSIIVNAIAGTYTLTLNDAHGYSVMKNIQIGGAQPISAAFNVSAASAQQHEDIVFTSNSTGAASYIWNFGDGTTLSSSTPVANHQYSAEGAYTVSLTATNTSGCQATVNHIVTVTQQFVSGINNVADNEAITTWSSDNTLFIDFGKQKQVNAVVDIYNVLGQQICSDRFTSNAIYSKQLSKMQTAYVIVKIKNNGEVITRKVLITNQQ